MNTESSVENKVATMYYDFLAELVESGCPRDILEEFQGRELGDALDRFHGSGNFIEEAIALRLEEIIEECGEESANYIPDQTELAKAIGCPLPVADDGQMHDNVFQAGLEAKERDDRETACKIATLYLEKFPREVSYGVALSSTEDDSEMMIYHNFDGQELEVLRECSRIATEEECALDEILTSEGHASLHERLLSHDTPFGLDIVDSVDLENPLKFTKFALQRVTDDGTLDCRQSVGVELSDEEFKEILVELLLNSNRYSMNMLVYRKPQICQEIMRHLALASMDFLFEDSNPFVAEMTELKASCESILSPFKDLLGIFDSEDSAIRDFARKHQIVPFCGEYNEIYSCYDDEGCFHTQMHFVGCRIMFSKEGFSYVDSDFHDEGCFTVEASAVMEKYGLGKPEDIYPYIVVHYGTADGFDTLRKELTGE